MKTHNREPYSDLHKFDSGYIWSFRMGMLKVEVSRILLADETHCYVYEIINTTEGAREILCKGSADSLAAAKATSINFMSAKILHPSKNPVQIQ